MAGGALFKRIEEEKGLGGWAPALRRGIRTVGITDCAVTAHADPEMASLAAAGRAVQRLTMDKGNLR